MPTFLFKSPASKILSITCDNASANDAMINRLATTLETFPGSANQTRCFAHILNLVAKCIMKQFDAPKKPEQRGENSEGDIEAELEPNHDDLEDGLGGLDDDQDEEEVRGRNDGEEELNRHERMTEDEINELEQSVKPVRHVLAKVSLLSKQ